MTLVEEFRALRERRRERNSVQLGPDHRAQLLEAPNIGPVVQSVRAPELDMRMAPPPRRTSARVRPPSPTPPAPETMRERIRREIEQSPSAMELRAPSLSPEARSENTSAAVRSGAEDRQRRYRRGPVDVTPFFDPVASEANRGRAVRGINRAIVDNADVVAQNQLGGAMGILSQLYRVATDPNKLRQADREMRGIIRTTQRAPEAIAEGVPRVAGAIARYPQDAARRHNVANGLQGMALDGADAAVAFARAPYRAYERGAQERDRRAAEGDFAGAADQQAANLTASAGAILDATGAASVAGGTARVLARDIAARRAAAEAMPVMSGQIIAPALTAPPQRLALPAPESAPINMPGPEPRVSLPGPDRPANGVISPGMRDALIRNNARTRMISANLAEDANSLSARADIPDDYVRNVEGAAGGSGSGDITPRAAELRMRAMIGEPTPMPAPPSPLNQTQLPEFFPGEQAPQTIARATDVLDAQTTAPFQRPRVSRAPRAPIDQPLPSPSARVAIPPPLRSATSRDVPLAETSITPGAPPRGAESAYGGSTAFPRLTGENAAAATTDHYGYLAPKFGQMEGRPFLFDTQTDAVNLANEIRATAEARGYAPIIERHPSGRGFALRLQTLPDEVRPVRAGPIPSAARDGLRGRLDEGPRAQISRDPALDGPNRPAQGNDIPEIPRQLNAETVRSLTGSHPLINSNERAAILILANQKNVGNRFAFQLEDIVSALRNAKVYDADVSPAAAIDRVRSFLDRAQTAGFPVQSAYRGVTAPFASLRDEVSGFAQALREAANLRSRPSIVQIAQSNGWRPERLVRFYEAARDGRLHRAPPTIKAQMRALPAFEIGDVPSFSKTTPNIRGTIADAPRAPSKPRAAKVVAETKGTRFRREMTWEERAALPNSNPNSAYSVFSGRNLFSLSDLADIARILRVSNSGGRVRTALRITEALRANPQAIESVKRAFPKIAVVLAGGGALAGQSTPLTR